MHDQAAAYRAVATDRGGLFRPARLQQLSLGGRGREVESEPPEGRARGSHTRKLEEITSADLHLRITSYNVCYTKLLRNVEGDPDHPINEGSLCAKGASIWQLGENDKRVLTPLYRAPYTDKWEPISWEYALYGIAKLV